MKRLNTLPDGLYRTDKLQATQIIRVFNTRDGLKHYLIDALTKQRLYECDIYGNKLRQC